MAGFYETMNTPGGYAAIGSIGNAINAIQNSNAYSSMLDQQTSQLKEQIAYQRKIMEEQIALRAQERIRQQMMAQAAGDAFANSLGQFSGFEGKAGAASGQIADAFRQVLARGGPSAIAPAATGAVADREVAAVQRANDIASQDAGNLANVQGLARAFDNANISTGRNNQLAAMLRNFAGGSAGASQAEIEARTGRLFQPEIVRPMPSMLGDLFVGLSGLGIKAAQPKQQSGINYSFDPLIPYTGMNPGGLRAGSGVGLSVDKPAGLGITGPTGMRIVGG